MDHNSNKTLDRFDTTDDHVSQSHSFLPYFRKKMLEKSVENEYERNLPSGPVYDAIDGLDMGHFTLSRDGNSRANDHG